MESGGPTAPPLATLLQFQGSDLRVGGVRCWGGHPFAQGGLALMNKKHITAVSCTSLLPHRMSVSVTSHHRHFLRCQSTEIKVETK